MFRFGSKAVEPEIFLKEQTPEVYERKIIIKVHGKMVLENHPFMDKAKNCQNVEVWIKSRKHHA